MPSDISVIPVIQLWEEFTKTKHKSSVEDFARWILENGSNGKQASSETAPEKLAGDIPTGPDESGQAALLVNRLQRMLQLMGKPLLKKIGFNKGQEYGMLVEIYLMGNPNKKELSKKMLMENSTGVEITRRLVKMGLIHEENDPEDKRSTRLSLTETGKKRLFDSYQSLGKIQEDFLRCLSMAERKQLVALLQQVEQYHAAKIEL